MTPGGAGEDSLGAGRVGGGRLRQGLPGEVWRGHIARRIRSGAHRAELTATGNRLRRDRIRRTAQEDCNCLCRSPSVTGPQSSLSFRFKYSSLLMSSCVCVNTFKRKCLVTPLSFSTE